MFKKIVIGILIFLVVIVAALFAIPYFFKDAIKAKIAQTINNNLDATVSFADADLSLFRSFPQANVAIDNLLIINKAPFAGDTLVSMGKLDLQMSIKELFKDASEPINVDGITSKNGFVNILFNKDGIGNFDIALKDKKDKPSGKNDPVNLSIKSYEINNFKFKYFDERSKIKLLLDSLDHTGKGDFAKSILDLDTKSRVLVSLEMDSVNYMNKVKLQLDAIVNINLDNSTYTFKENNALINKLPLTFNGAIQLLDKGQRYDLTFKTPTSSFQNFLRLIPSAYSGKLDNVQTTGDFSVSGFAKGIYSETTVPKFNLAISSDNASFKYPDLPKAVTNIVIDTKIINETGQLNDTYINLDKLSFKIDQDVFNASANIRNVVDNPLVNAKLKGTINLANVSKAYPIKLSTPLSGILNADIVTKFDMKSVEESRYENMQNSGNMTVTGFNYQDGKSQALSISTASVQFDTYKINLQNLEASTGRSDMKIQGILENFYGFMFKKQVLKGNFNMASNQFAVSDFMTTEQDKSATPGKKEPVKIPAFLDCTLNATANTVLYDNLVLKNVSGRVIIKDEKAVLENVKTSIFGGNINLSGTVSTKAATPTFLMELGLVGVDIAQTFTQLEMMKNIAPIAGVISGKLNSTIKVNGNLDAKEMTPNLKSLTGNLIGQLLSTTINEQNSALLSQLDQNIKFIDLKKFNLNDLKAALTFENGRVNVKPFDLKYQDIKVTVGGSHGFDESMAYNLKFDVPAKYLGTEANKLLASLSPADQAKIQSIPITANLTGSFNNPSITTDVQSAVSNLATQLVQQQKDKLIQQGTNALGNLINNNTKPKDSTKPADPQTQIVKDKATELLNGLFNKKPKKKE